MRQISGKELTNRVTENKQSTSAFVDNRSWEQIVGNIYAKQYEYDSKPVTQQLMGPTRLVPIISSSNEKRVTPNLSYSYFV
jgi:hypothetical protein